MKHYCMMCGAKMEMKVIEDREREICPNCEWIYYKQYKVSAGVRIEKNGRLLLVQRGIEPWKSKWYLPAGYLEVDEEPQQAAVREAREETGLNVKILGLAGIYTYNDDPRGNGIVFLYDAEVSEGELKLSSETLDVGYYSVEEISLMQLANMAAKKQVSDWLVLHGNTQGTRA